MKHPHNLQATTVWPSGILKAHNKIRWSWFLQITRRIQHLLGMGVSWTRTVAHI